jgi:hypothetical protein
MLCTVLSSRTFPTLAVLCYLQICSVVLAEHLLYSHHFAQLRTGMWQVTVDPAVSMVCDMHSSEQMLDILNIILG